MTEATLLLFNPPHSYQSYRELRVRKDFLNLASGQALKAGGYLKLHSLSELRRLSERRPFIETRPYKRRAVEFCPSRYCEAQG